MAYTVLNWAWPSTVETELSILSHGSHSLTTIPLKSQCGTTPKLVETCPYFPTIQIYSPTTLLNLLFHKVILLDKVCLFIRS